MAYMRKKKSRSFSKIYLKAHGMKMQTDGSESEWGMPLLRGSRNEL